MNNEFNHKLAVYGTLKQGFGNNRLLTGCKLLGVETISGFKMYSCGGFPALNKADNDCKVEIEVYEVNDEQTLKDVYRLEGYSGKRDAPEGNWYDTTDVETSHGKAEIFYFKRDMSATHTLVEDGVWRKREW